jgi:hypothetical protein
MVMSWIREQRGEYRRMGSSPPLWMMPVAWPGGVIPCALNMSRGASSHHRGCVRGRVGGRCWGSCSHPRSSRGSVPPGDAELVAHWTSSLPVRAAWSKPGVEVCAGGRSCCAAAVRFYPGHRSGLGAGEPLFRLDAATALLLRQLSPAFFRAATLGARVAIIMSRGGRRPGRERRVN